MGFPSAEPRRAYKVPLCEFAKGTPQVTKWKKASFPLARCRPSQGTLLASGRPISGPLLPCAGCPGQCASSPASLQSKAKSELHPSPVPSKPHQPRRVGQTQGVSGVLPR